MWRRNAFAEHDIQRVAELKYLKKFSIDLDEGFCQNKVLLEIWR